MVETSNTWPGEDPSVYDTLARSELWNPQVMYRGRPMQEQGKAMLRTLFESVSDGLFILECLPEGESQSTSQPRYRFLVCNPTFRRMFFLHPRPIEGENLLSCLTASTAAQIQLHTQHCVKHRRRVSFELSLVDPASATPDQEQTHILIVTLSPVLEGEKPIRQIVGSCQDITARKQVEWTLQRSQERLLEQNRALMALTRHKALNQGDLQAALREICTTAAHTLRVERVGVWLYTPERSSIRCVNQFEISPDNPEGSHTQGAEIWAKDYPRYFHALEQERTIAADQVAKDPRTVEFRNSYLTGIGVVSMLDAPIRLEGQMVGILCHARVGFPRRWTLEDQNFAGSLADLVSLALEISERRQMEEALRRAEERYRNFFENAVEGIFFTDAAGRYLSANPMLAQICGYDSPEALMQEVNNVGTQLYVDPGQREEFVRLLHKQGSVRGFEYQIRRRDGSIIWVRENARLVKDSEGNILGYEGISEDITAQKQNLAHIEFRAHHDALTSLVNREYFSDQLQQALKQYRNEMLALLFVDLDHFKDINDTLGHGVGDALLRGVAQRLTECVRSGDTVARWGGDEFTLLLPQIGNPVVSMRLAQRILDAFQDPFSCQGHTIAVTCSIGIALYPQDGVEVRTLLHHADLALYRVKENGRNGFQLYSPIEGIPAAVRSTIL
ncbi:MAG: diguanylate cyclase [Thermostichus sp. DG02_5_bins_236]